MNELPDDHAMKDPVIIKAEGQFQASLKKLAADWILLKEIRLQKLYIAANGPASAEVIKAFVADSILDQLFQMQDIEDNVCANLEEEISNQVNDKYS